jgi:polysaccharide pyruvyl transferase WcaK-like protein
MKILVYGFFKKLNIGDNLFIEAYRELFPEYQFTFTEKITEELFLANDALFLGGGSFLDGQPEVSRDLLEKLPSKPIIYLGVGAETNIHPWHKFLLQSARLVCIRSQQSIDKIKALNPNTIYCPDLVYALGGKAASQPKKAKSVLFLPNSHIVSKWNDAAWKHAAWEYFKSEFSQTLESLVDQGYSIDVLPMCHAAIEIVNKMIKGKINILSFKEHDFTSLSQMASTYELIISQRYHGLIISDIICTPCINIHHHDKLKNFSGMFTKNVDYYRISKSSLLDSIDNALFVKSLQSSDGNMVINSDAFKSLKDKVKRILFKD